MGGPQQDRSRATGFERGASSRFPAKWRRLRNFRQPGRRNGRTGVGAGEVRGRLSWLRGGGADRQGAASAVAAGGGSVATAECGGGRAGRGVGRRGAAL